MEVSRESRDDELHRMSARVPPHISLYRRILWGTALVVALFLFYVVFGVFWFGLRALAWTAEFRARRRRAGKRQ